MILERDGSVLDQLTITNKADSIMLELQPVQMMK